MPNPEPVRRGRLHSLGPMPSDAPRETTVEELANKLKSADAFVLLDVREPWELAVARIQDARVETVPISRLARGGVDVLPASAREPQAEIYVLCHHGIRSADVTRWLASQGWQNVFSVAGGIAEYARKIDRSVGSY